MGMGKSLATLSALDIRFLAGESKPALIIAPKRVAQSVWPDEAKKWDHLRQIEVSPIIGTVKERIAAFKKPASVFTINYENLPWLIDWMVENKYDWHFNTVVCDEATKLKSMRPSVQRSAKGTEFIRVAGGIRARELARIAHKRVKYWTNLTGTPAPNGLQDVWGPTWFLDQGARLGRSYEAFTQRWFRPCFNGYGIEPLPYSQEQIQAKLRDICLTLKAEDYLDLPPLIKNVIRVELPGRARRLYKDMEREMFLELNGHEVEAFNAAAKTMKCLQLANGAIYTDDAGNWQGVHDAKLEALESVINEAAGAPVLVAYHFKSDLARLRRAFPKGRPLDSDPRTITEWNAGRVPILFAHPASAGHGLNLQDGGNILAFFSVNWNLEEHLQIIERIGPTRQAQSGRNRPVFVHYIIADGTIDDLVLARLESKRSIQDILMGAMRR